LQKWIAHAVDARAAPAISVAVKASLIANAGRRARPDSRNAVGVCPVSRKEAREVACVREAECHCDLLDVEIAEEQVALRFGQHACVNELQCAMPGQLAADAVELRRGDADRPGVVRDVILFAIVGLQQLLELPEVPGRPAAGLRLRRGRRLCDARDAHQHQRQQRR
jgi:hypothetical protein